MLTPRQDFETTVAQAASRLWEQLPEGPFVRPCLDLRHGDFQTNLALVLGKQLKANPRDLAAALAKELEPALQGKSLPPEIAGAGFLNFRLTPEYVAKQVTLRAKDPRLGIEPIARTKTVVIDFSSPNIAKEMHVGHLRSTVLGDSLARIHRFLGHNVITDNHLGDWGTGFGIVLFGFKRDGDPKMLENDPFSHLEEIYQRVNNEAKTDPSIKEGARKELVKLQQGDPENLKIWHQLIEMSIGALKGMYARLGVTFDHWLGESFYNDAMQGVVDELQAAGIARESRGAIAIFSDGKLDAKKDPFLVKKDGEVQDQPLIIHKSDDGFNYATSDFATLLYRKNVFKADRILYVVDGRQELHFRQLFNAAERWGILNDVQVEHIGFGTMLGLDGKPLKTREGGSVKLKKLIQEAEERAHAIIEEKQPDLCETERKELARVVGLGALKYADLAQNRNVDYVFTWEKLLAFDGNTAPYIQNAYVRTRAIFRKAGLEAAPNVPVILEDPAELALGKKLIELADSLELAALECRPHMICQHLFDTATLFHKFYEACPVLKEGVPSEVRDSRLVLCAYTGATLKLGLSLLGIETVERM